MREVLLRRARWGVLCAAFGLLIANASSEVDVVAVDLAPLIDRAAPRRAQFAVDVPHAVSLDTHGTWTRANGVSTWTYTARVPGAVSLSFHAPNVVLPQGATLRVHAGGETYDYDRLDVPRRELWSRLAKGDTLSFELHVPSALVTSAAFEIASLQAGYRSIVPGGRNHPHFDALSGAGRMAALDSTNGEAPPTANATGESCLENYACRANAANENASASTVVVFVRNLYQCTGTLLADVPGTFAPYVATARHCQEDDVGNDDPGAAASVVVYWNAVSACGQPLASVFAASKASQSGATTRVLQQDGWLLRLNDAPAWDGAYWSGWDATGGTFTGGYSVHHASGGAQQFTQWYGQAVSATYANGRYTSGVWRVQNEIGNVGLGASGGALFDPANRAVGVLSRAAVYRNDPTGYGVCPTTPPTVPTASSWSAEYVALSSVWNATADATSSTGATTFKSVLDPQNSGTLVADGRAGPPRVELTLTSTATPQVGVGSTLSWTATRADSCVASGGGPGSTWPGTGLPASGSRTFTETTDGRYEYTLTCSRGALSGSAVRTLEWSLPPATVTLTSNLQSPVYQTESVRLDWSSNVGPCTASGSGIGADWSGAKANSGSQTVTIPANASGLALYRLECGVAPRATASEIAFTTAAPVIEMYGEAIPPSLRTNTPLFLGWNAGARSCTATGGRTGDAWTPLTGTSNAANVTSSTAGAVTYGVSCTAGTRTITDSRTINWTTDPPSATLSTVSPQQIRLYGGPGPANLSWTANVKSCAITYSGPTGGTLALDTTGASGVFSDQRQQPGRYTYTLACGTGAETATSTATIDWEWPTPAISLRVTNEPTYVDEGAWLLWESNVLPCTASGGAAGDGWAGTRAGNGSFLARPATPGSYTYRLTCGEGAQVGEATVTANVVASPAPTVRLQLAGSTAQPGQGVSITWESRYAQSCTASGGTAASGWAGPRPTTGSAIVQEPVEGTYTYTLACTNGTGTTQSSATLDVANPPGATATLNASATSVAPGQPFTLSWSSTIATACTASGGAPGDGWAGGKAPAGQQSVLLNAAGTYSYAIQCGGSPLAQRTITVAAPSAPAVTLTANPATLALGASVTLDWTSAGATSCTATGGAPADGWAGVRAAQGRYVATPSAAGAYTYAMECTHPPFTTRVEQAVTVTAAPPPTASLTTNVATTTAGDAFTLTWSSTNATACTASGGATGDGWSGSSVGTSGSRSVTAGAAGSYTYVLDCTGAGGSVRAQSAITVNARPAGGGGGGGGGGGAFGVLAFALLGLVPLARRMRRA